MPELSKNLNAQSMPTRPSSQERYPSSDFQDSWKRFLLAVRKAPDGFYDWDILTNEAYFSPRWKEMLGYTDVEISSSIDEWTSRLHPEDQGSVSATLHSLLAGNALEYQVEYRLRHKDGSYRWILSQGAILRDADDIAISTSGWNVDLTERKQEEAASQEQRRELLLLLEVPHLLTSNHEIPQLLDTLLEHLKTIVDFSGAALYGMVGDRHELLFSNRRPFPSQTQRIFQLLVQDASPAKLSQQREPVIVDDLHTHPRFVQDYIHVLDQQPEVLAQFRSWMAVPLLTRERVVGLITLNHHRPHFYTHEHARFTFALINQALFHALEYPALSSQAHTYAALLERIHQAHNLHGAVYQHLYGISLCTLGAQEALETEATEAKSLLNSIQIFTEIALADLRAIEVELNPEMLETEGVLSVLRHLLDVFALRHSLQVEATMEEEPALPLRKKYGLYRIAAEALENVVQHARTSKARLRLVQEEEEFLLEVSDEGKGFELAAILPGQGGLRIMREQANRLDASLSMRSSPRQGTTVQVRFPLRSYS